jgi:Spy/CpxP family protein refolding chaperone
MSKTRFIVLGSFLLAFAAGTSLGLLVTRPSQPAKERSRLAVELNLTSDQEDQMWKISRENMGSIFRQQGERRSAFAQERDLAIQSLLTDEQLTWYDVIQQNYADQMDALAAERKRAFDEATVKIKQFLTPEQAAKYDELMKEQRERGGLPGLHGPRGRHPATATAPAGEAAK